MTFSLDLLSCKVFVSEEIAEHFKIDECYKEYMLSHIPPLERRRLNQGAKGVFTLLHECKDPIIFSSFNGEINSGFRMYETLKEDLTISPLSFSLSVLNAIPALCAMMFKDTHEILAISEKMSLEYGLLNAFLLLNQQKNQTCTVIAYREIEEFYSPRGIIILLLRVKHGSQFTLKRFCSGSRQEQIPSEVVFLKNYKKEKQWHSYSEDESWMWHA